MSCCSTLPSETVSGAVCRDTDDNARVVRWAPLPNDPPPTKPPPEPPPSPVLDTVLVPDVNTTAPPQNSHLSTPVTPCTALHAVLSQSHLTHDWYANALRTTVPPIPTSDLIPPPPVKL